LQEEGEHEHDHALADPEGEKGLLVAAGRDHVGDRHHGDCSSRAEAGGGRARSEAAVIGKPFQRIADAGSVHRAGADAAEDGADVKQRQRIGVGVQHPGKGDHHRAKLDDNAGAKFVDEPGFDRNQPGLRHHEQGEGELDRGATPVKFRVDRIDEQRPAILQVCDHRHADETHHQLHPAIIRGLRHRLDCGL